MQNLFDKVNLAPFPAITEFIPQEFPDYSPKWPISAKQFSASKELCFSSEEIPLLQDVENLASELGYDNHIVGKLNENLLLS